MDVEHRHLQGIGIGQADDGGVADHPGCPGRGDDAVAQMDQIGTVAQRLVVQIPAGGKRIGHQHEAVIVERQAARAARIGDRHLMRLEQHARSLAIGGVEEGAPGLVAEIVHPGGHRWRRRQVGHGPV
jgi:hypothetical protein